ncbi:ribosomal protein S8 [Xylaria nigripes]|nr:ribosomal protein S8 [Xylaria nigripes]
MVLANVVNMASQLNNAVRAKLGLTSVVPTKYNIKVAVALHRAGYITALTRGSKTPPDPATIETFEPEPLTTNIVSSQRLWLVLRYHNNKPVMGSIRPITTGKRPVTANLKSLEKLVRGFEASNQRGLDVGESLIVATDRGMMEAREAVEHKIGGLLICRIGP